MDFKYYVYRLTDTTYDPYDIDSYTQEVRQVYPINSDTQKKMWVKDDNNYFFREELGGDLIFKDSAEHQDYTFFNDLQSDETWKYFRHLFVIKNTSDDSVYLRVFFSITDGTYNPSRHIVSFKTQPIDKYSCIKEKEDIKVNILNQTMPVTVEASLPENLEYDFVLREIHGEGSYYRGSYYDSQTELLAAIPSVYDYPFKWEAGNLAGGFIKINGINHEIMCQARARFACEGGDPPAVVGYTALGSCGADGTILMYKDSYNIDFQLTQCINGVPQQPTAPSTDGWFLVLNDCSIGENPAWNIVGTALWVEMTYTELTFSNGRTIKSVIEKLVEGCGFEFDSKFFYNYYNPITGLYTTPNKLDNLILFQKSDVKRPNATDDARVLETTFAELMEELAFLLNGGWFIDDDNKLRFEHIKFFEGGNSYTEINTSDTDLTESGAYSEFIKGKTQYSYDKTNLPEKERWEIVDSELEDFANNNIDYNFGCVEKGTTIPRNTSLIATDVFTIYFKSESISDDGAVLMQCSEDGGVLSLDSEDGVLSGSLVANGHLAIANLLDKYWRYGRPLKKGVLNGSTVDFESSQKTKKQETLSYKLCSDTFNPDRFKTTELGDGQVFGAEQSFKTGVVNVDLTYEL